VPTELSKLKQLETFRFQPEGLTPQAREWVQRQLGGTLVKPGF